MQKALHYPFSNKMNQVRLIELWQARLLGQKYLSA